MSKKAKHRAYSESFLQYGFTETGGNPQCVICYEVLANSCMNPAKLSRHLATKHPSFKDRTVDYFTKKKQQLEAQKVDSFKVVRLFFISKYRESMFRAVASI